MAASNLSWTADDSKLTEIIELFLSSSPSVIHLQQFFFVLSRVAVSYHNIKYLQFSRFI